MQRPSGHRMPPLFSPSSAPITEPLPSGPSRRTPRPAARPTSWSSRRCDWCEFHSTGCAPADQPTGADTRRAAASRADAGGGGCGGWAVSGTGMGSSPVAITADRTPSAPDGGGDARRPRCCATGLIMGLTDRSTRAGFRSAGGARCCCTDSCGCEDRGVIGAADSWWPVNRPIGEAARWTGGRTAGPDSCPTGEAARWTCPMGEAAREPPAPSPGAGLLPRLRR